MTTKHEHSNATTSSSINTSEHYDGAECILRVAEAIQGYEALTTLEQGWLDGEQKELSIRFQAAQHQHSNSICLASQKPDQVAVSAIVTFEGFPVCLVPAAIEKLNTYNNQCSLKLELRQCDTGYLEVEIVVLPTQSPEQIRASIDAFLRVIHPLETDLEDILLDQ